MWGRECFVWPFRGVRAGRGGRCSAFRWSVRADSWLPGSASLVLPGPAGRRQRLFRMFRAKGEGLRGGRYLCIRTVDRGTSAGRRLDQDPWRLHHLNALGRTTGHGRCTQIPQTPPGFFVIGLACLAPAMLDLAKQPALRSLRKAPAWHSPQNTRSHTSRQSPLSLQLKGRYAPHVTCLAVGRLSLPGNYDASVRSCCTARAPWERDRRTPCLSPPGTCSSM